jgi:hypothetical protein
VIVLCFIKDRIDIFCFEIKKKQLKSYIVNLFTVSRVGLYVVNENPR